jgi:hypothetical protein
MIVRILYAFFSAVRNIFKDENDKPFWDLDVADREVNVLQTNVGFQALLKVLVDLLRVISEDKKDDRKNYEQILHACSTLNVADQGEIKRYPFTSSTISVLYEDILRLIDTGN